MATVGLLAGCGGSSSATTPAAERLQREDLVAAAHGLRQAEASATREMAAARVAWPLVANGLPATGTTLPPATLRALSGARAAARALVLPALMGETAARSLTGPAAGVTGLYRTFHGLTQRGWTLVAAAGAEVDGGPAAAARFARENVALYIDSVYDGHFDAALVGKSLLAGYKKLGGAQFVRGFAHAGGSLRARRRLLAGGRAAAPASGGQAGVVAAATRSVANSLVAGSCSGAPVREIPSGADAGGAHRRGPIESLSEGA